MPNNPMYGELVLPDLPNGVKPKSKVCLIYTGGTIGMVPSDSRSRLNPKLRPASLDELLSAVPGVGVAECIQIGMVSFIKPVDSSDVTAKHWIAIGDAIEEHYEAFDGFVVLHGTDTMAFTTSALSFILNDLAKPVVVTGSQLPIKHPRTDGVQNLINSIYLASHEAVDLPLVPEVVLLFDNLILRGNRSTKVSSDHMQGFESPNFPPLGDIGEHIRIREELVRQPPDNKRFPFHTDKRLANEVKVIPVHPGLTPSQLKRDLRTRGLDGAILLTYGAGNVPTDPDFLTTIREIVRGGEGIEKTFPVLNVTQCKQGMVEMGLYEASGGLLEAGVTSGLDLTFEAAIAKMYWALEKFKDREAIHNALQGAQRGEQSQNQLDLFYEPQTGANRSSASRRIETGGKRIPGRYDRERLKRAVLRIHGLGYEPMSEAGKPAVRVFINEPKADETTSLRGASFFWENELVSPHEDDMLLDITRTVRRVVHEGSPVEITLVGINARLWCRSIHVSLYTDAIHGS